VGSSLQLPSYLLDLSPFAHAPRLPGGEFDATAAGVLTALAAGLAGVGLLSFRRRDLT
jgi:ABC-2 type transport system permease protein